VDDAVNPANVIILNSDGHGHLTWTLNFPSDWGFNIYWSADGTTWGHTFDGADGGAASAATASMSVRRPRTRQLAFVNGKREGLARSSLLSA
jgi:hypothetical protein